MNNKELMAKIENILKIDNFCDLIEQLYAFEKEYQQSSFYKTTKMKLFDLVEAYKKLNPITLNGIFAELQRRINDLDLTNLHNLLDQFGNILDNENSELNNIINSVNMKEISSLLGSLKEV